MLDRTSKTATRVCDGKSAVAYFVAMPKGALSRPTGDCPQTY